ncbi:MAG: hypothetical protein ABI867_26020 [Kofleriaceae bacterium]
MRVRETLWFKMGEQAASPQPANDEAPTAPELPIEERYADDGSVTATDQANYSVKTGTTSYVPVIADADAPPADDSHLDSLVGEMKRGRRKIFAVLGASAVVICAIVLYVS